MSNTTMRTNVGTAVSDMVAAGDDFETQDQWLDKHGVQREGRIVLKKLSHVRYQHPDLNEIKTFLQGTVESFDSN